MKLNLTRAGHDLYQIRKDAGISQRAMGEQCHCTASLISIVEQGKAKNLEIICYYIMFFKISPEQIESWFDYGEQ